VLGSKVQPEPVILDEILDHKRTEIEEREREHSLDEVKQRAQVAPSPRIMKFDGTVSLIAEVKRRSPSAGALAPDVDPVVQAQAYERAGAAAISVLTDHQYFGGTLDDLAAVRGAVNVPVLCKDFILSPYQVYEARAYGADLMLLIMAALRDDALRPLRRLTIELGMTPLVEVHDQHDLARALAAEANVIGINNRDLTDFSVDLLTTEYLAPLIPDDVIVVSESGIVERTDVQRVTHAGARAVLIGSTLMRSDDPEATIRELLG
jgi:indole-3-glycerol phosphate synthase